MLKVVTQREIIREAQQSWLSQYINCPDGKHVGWGDRSCTFGEIRARVTALNVEACSEADVDAAIGVSGWARLECDGCGENAERLMHIGDEPGYEARWQWLCEACLERALHLLRTPPVTA